MKKQIVLTLIMAFCLICPGVVRALDLDGARYEGQAKMAGQPLDFWTVVTFDDEDADFNIANVIKPSGEYTLTGTGDNLTLTIKIGTGKYILKSNDGGGSFTGTITARDNKFTLCILKVPAKQVAATQPTSELDKIVGSEDGYTAFLHVVQQGGKFCIPADITFDAINHGCKVTFDNASFQKMFGNLQSCKYSVDGSKITLYSTTVNFTATGTIYDSGNYISIPMGNAQGMDISLILIR